MSDQDIWATKLFPIKLSPNFSCLEALEEKISHIKIFWRKNTELEYKNSHLENSHETISIPAFKCHLTLQKFKLPKY